MKKIFVAGHKGMVGSAICRQLKKQNVLVSTVSKDEVDLLNQSQVENFFSSNDFDEVYLAAAKVGGIHANNTFPAQFIYQNLMIQSNVINSAYKNNVKKLLFLGSSCIYPKLANQPMTESSLLTGSLEPTNEPYAIAKIAGIKLCEGYNRQYGVDYRSIMPSNLYGPGDNYHTENSHVIPSLIRRFHEAKEKGSPSVIVWGTGKVFREFLHVDDLASASIYIMNLSKPLYLQNTSQMCSHINVGHGSEYSIKKLTEMIANITGFKGEIIWDSSMPDGPPRKLMNSSLLEKLGWSPKISLEEGLADAYDWFKLNIHNA